MNSSYRIFFSVLVSATVIISMTTCGGKFFNYNPIHEIPEGPGILTDQTDGAVLYGSKSEGYIQRIKKNRKTKKAMLPKKPSPPKVTRWIAIIPTSRNSKNTDSGKSGLKQLKIRLNINNSLSSGNGKPIGNGSSSNLNPSERIADMFRLGDDIKGYEKISVDECHTP